MVLACSFEFRSFIGGRYIEGQCLPGACGTACPDAWRNPDGLLEERTRTGVVGRTV